MQEPHFFLPPVVHAADYRATDAGEQIRKAASILPGMGKPDVYYPSLYEGQWVCEQEITGIELKDAGGDTAQQQGRPLLLRLYGDALKKSGGKLPKYTRVYSNYNDRVVLDRGASDASFFNALSSAASPGTDNQEKWLASFEPGNANNVRLASSSGLTLDTRVTKRSIENMEGTVVNGKAWVPVTTLRKADALGYSEFTRVVEDTPKGETGGGIFETRIYGTRLLARNKAVGDDEVLALERLYVYTEEGELTNKPLAIVKSKISLRREK